MYEVTLIATGILLVLGFVAAELYVRRRGITGTITKLEELGPFPMGLALRASVRLSNGREIEADLPACTACMEHLRIGDSVRLLANGSLYHITGRCIYLDRNVGDAYCIESCKTASPLELDSSDRGAA